MENKKIQDLKIENAMFKNSRILHFKLSFFILLFTFCIFAPFGANAATIGKPSNFINFNRGLVGYWTFDGKDMLNGKALDRSGNNNTGTLVNIATSTFYKAGKIGQGFNFDGVNDYASTTINLFSANTPVTISAWFKTPITNTVGTVKNIVFIPNQTYDAAGIGMINGQINFSIGTEEYATGLHSSTNGLAINRWYLVVGTFDGTVQKLYINGVYVTQASSATLNAFSSLNIGRSASSASRYFNGLIDDVRIYNRALSAGEIKQLYNMGGDKIAKTVAPVNNLKSGLVGYWTFDGKDMLNGKALDRSGNNNTGSLMNIATSTFYKAGKIGQGFNFDGVNDGVNLNSNTNFNLSGSNAFTISGWVKPTIISSSYKAIFARGFIASSAVNRTYYLSSQTGAGDGSRITAGVSDGTNVITLTTTVNGFLVANQWIYITLAFNGVEKTLTLYRNGNYYTQATNASFTTIWDGDAANDRQTGIGATFTGEIPAQVWQGFLDDVRVYKRALSAGGEKELYNLGR